jgi:hypothetical protein
LTATITLDATAPVNGTLTATPGAGQIALSWSGFTDTPSGIGSYKVVFATGTAPASCATGTTIYSGPDASYTHTGLSNLTYGYRVCAIDGAGNISTGAIKTAKPLPSETNAPTGSIQINSGAEWTKSAAVTLTLTATDDSPPIQMCISNTTTCTTWIAYTATKSWTLVTGNGLKTVYVKYRDTWGNTTPDPLTATITLDATAPVNGTLTATPGAGQIALSWSGFSDGVSGSGIANYKLVYATGTPPASCSTGTPIYTGTDTTFTHTGLSNLTTYGYRVCAIDNAGNVSTGATKSAKPIN